MKTKVLYIILLLHSVVAYGENIIKLQILDNATPISYCDVSIANSLFFIADEKGEVQIQASLLGKGDTIRIASLGYKQTDLIVTEELLEQKHCSLQLQAQEYVMDEIEVKAAFDSRKFFNNKKKNLIVPYTDKHYVNVLAKISYTNEQGFQQTEEGSLRILYKKNDVSIIASQGIKDSILQKNISRCLSLATYTIYSYCFPKFQKLSDFEYKGVQNDRWCFQTAVKRDALTHPFYGFQSSDKSSTQVSIDQEGYISAIETQVIINSGASHSYNLYAEYIDINSQIAPAYISTSIFTPSNLSHTKKGVVYGNDLHIELWCKYEY